MFPSSASDSPGKFLHSPQDPRNVLKQAAHSMFAILADTAEGILVVDREGRVEWVSEAYQQFLPDLGFEDRSDIVGRAVEEVVPNTLMRDVLVSGKPILVDLLINKAGTFLVSRFPVRDDAGEVIGAVAMILMTNPESTMQPLMKKFAMLQRELDDTRKQLAEQRRPKYTIASFIGSSPQVMEIKRLARRVAQSDSTVLLLGETGTGKELLAHAIHADSSRAARPFVGVNIAAVPDTLLEAELFGVAPGAYTGADRKGRDGKFKLADGGTLFLDEIGDMPLALQAKLLRALQEQEFEPLGSNRVCKVDMRVLAATSRDLPAMVAAGRFREDLYYRLNVVPIRLPALRERLSDLEVLVEALEDDIARRSGMAHRELTPEAFALLRRHDWRGNIRELRNVLEQAIMLNDELKLDAHHFMRVLPDAGKGVAAAPMAPNDPHEVIEVTSVDAAASPAGVMSLAAERAALERERIHAALRATGGNKLAASRLLKISRSTLYEKLALWPWSSHEVSD